MNELLGTENMISFFILVILEIVLGIDNVIFVSIIMSRLKKERDQLLARRIWMITGMISRTLLLFGLSWLLQQKGNSILEVFHKSFDLASIVMISGGLFLIYKSVMEIHGKLEGDPSGEKDKKKTHLRLLHAIGQIILIDAIFSFDSIITAGGTAKHLETMVAAVIIAMIVMFLFSPSISKFIHHHPTIKMLALSFLVMIGLSLVIEGWDAEKAEALKLKNYIYFGMAFSFLVEILNLIASRKKKKGNVVELNEPMLDDQ